MNLKLSAKLIYNNPIYCHFCLAIDNPSDSLKAEFMSIIEVMKRLPVHNGVTNLLGCITREGNL